jgi:hypothetical protein
MAGERRDRQRIPDASEVRALLEKYFDGPITDAQVALVASKVRDIASDPAKLKTEIHAFYANAGRYHGRMWREELAMGPVAPDVVDLVPWLGSTLDGLPPPRGYCPKPLAGTWEGEGARWQLSPDGALSTTQVPFTGSSSWYVRRRGDEVGDLLLLPKSLGGPVQLTIKRVTDDELELRYDVKPFVLRRVR